MNWTLFHYVAPCRVLDFPGPMSRRIPHSTQRRSRFMYTTEDLHFRFSPGSPAARSEEWEEVVSNTHLPMSVRPSPQPGGGRFFGRIRRQSLDDLALVDCACGACTGSRGRARIAAGDDDYVGLMITRTGSEVMSFGGVERVHLPGTLLTWDTE